MAANPFNFLLYLLRTSNQSNSPNVVQAADAENNQGVDILQSILHFPSDFKEAKESDEAIYNIFNRRILTENEMRAFVQKLIKANQSSLIVKFCETVYKSLSPSEKSSEKLRFVNYNLGLCLQFLYYNNIDHSNSFGFCYKFYELASKYIKEAHTRMGEMHLFHGTLIDSVLHIERRRSEDEEAAVRCFKLADVSDINARFWLSRIRQILCEDPPHIYERSAQRIARSHDFKVYQELAELGHPEACSELGHMYEFNLVPDLTLDQNQRLKLAQHFYKKGSELGSTLGTCRLLLFYKKHFAKLQRETNPDDPSAFIDSEGSKMTSQMIFRALNNALTMEASSRSIIPHNHQLSRLVPLIFAVIDCYFDNFGIDKPLDDQCKREIENALKSTFNSRSSNADEHYANEIGALKLKCLAFMKESDPKSRQDYLLHAVQLGKWSCNSIELTGVVRIEAHYQLFCRATSSSPGQFGFETLKALQQACSFQSKVEEVYQNPSIEYNEFDNSCFDYHLVCAASGGHPEALQAAITHYMNAASNLPKQMETALYEKHKLRFLRKAYEFIKLAEYKDVKITGIDHKVFQENLKIDLEIEALVSHYLENVLKHECKGLFDAFFVARCKEIENIDYLNNANIVNHGNLSASHKLKQDMKARINFEKFLKDKDIIVKLRTYYCSSRNWSSLDNRATKLFFAQHTASDILPRYLQTDFSFEIVLGRMFQQRMNDLRFQGFLMGMDNKLGADSAVKRSLQQSELFDRRLLFLLKSFVSDSFVYVDTNSKPGQKSQPRMNSMPDSNPKPLPPPS